MTADGVGPLHKIEGIIMNRYVYKDIIEQWDQMPSDFCSRLFESVSRRIRATIQAAGL